MSAVPTASAQTNPQPSLVDYAGFSELTGEVQQYRQTRLIDKARFMELADQPGTLILDTRSRQAYAQGHIEGAVHLNFSDFTAEKLAKTIGNKDRRILIYCNNNFIDNEPPMLLKRVELALNIPTFINLYGYGYRNVYELSEAIRMDDPELRIVSTWP